jgi:heme/copper-type cytochrome/quinol oxidase subunit 2
VLVPVILVAGVALLIGLFFVFRGGSDNETSTGGGTTGESFGGPESQFLIIVRNGKPAIGVQHLTAPKGGRIVLRVTSDVSDEVHVHGYDLMQDVGPGKPVQIRFVANIVGRFVIELEHRGTPLAELEVS